MNTPEQGCRCCCHRVSLALPVSSAAVTYCFRLFPVTYVALDFLMTLTLTVTRCKFFVMTSSESVIVVRGSSSLSVCNIESFFGLIDLCRRLDNDLLCLSRLL